MEQTQVELKTFKDDSPYIKTRYAASKHSWWIERNISIKREERRGVDVICLTFKHAGEC